MAVNDRPLRNSVIYNEAGNEIGTNTNPLVTYMVDTGKSTYAATAVAFAYAASGTDIFTITGSATRTVRILRITITGTQTTGAMRDVLLIKRSAANTGGTSATPTIVPYDSNSAAATAVVRNYTANPSGLGSAVGTIYAAKFFLSGTAAVAGSINIEFGPRYGQAIVLRGVAQTLAINMNAVTSTGNSMTISVEWTEE